MKYFKVMLVWIFIIVIVGFFYNISSDHGPRITPEIRIKADINTLKTATELYNSKEGSYPNKLDDLLSTNTKSGPYISKLATDVWGRDYIFRRPGPNGNPYDILSLGEDGKPGGQDIDSDISVWDGLAEAPDKIQRSVD